MDRAGDFMRKIDGVCHGKFVWCDLGGRYEADGTMGTAEFVFHTERVRACGNVVVRCKKYRQSCSVRALLKEDGEIISVNGPHLHPPEYGGHVSTVLTTRGKWLREVRHNPQERPMEVIRKHRRGLPMEAAVEIVPIKNTRTARRWAAHERPDQVHNLDQLFDALKGEEMIGYNVTDDNERLIPRRLPNFDSLLVTTRRQLDALSTTTRLQADATYQVLPLNLCDQLLTIHEFRQGVERDHVALVAFAFMKKCSMEAYQEVFRALREEAPALAITEFMGDFDGAIRAAVRDTFPGVRTLGCLFHFSQSLVRYASKPTVGFAKELKNPGPVMRRILAFAALPLLPPKLIGPTFEECARDALVVNKRFEPFIRYIRRFWIGVIGADTLSLYRTPSRANNSVESCNAHLKQQAGTHTSIWKLMAVLCDMCQDEMIDFNIHTRGVEDIRSVQHAETKLNDEITRWCWDRLDSGEFSPRSFVERLKYRVSSRSVKKKLSGRKKVFEGLDEWNQWVSEQLPIDYEEFGRGSIQTPDDQFSSSPLRTFITEEVLDRQEDSLPSFATLDHEYAQPPQANPRIPELSDAMCEKIRDALSRPADEIVIRVGSQAVKRKDLQTLSGNQWLNDVIMDVYLTLIVDRSKANPHLPKVLTLNTFFFMHYKSCGYDVVRRWTRNLDVFDHDIILIPVHMNHHWTMLVIDLRSKRVKYMDSLGATGQDCLRTALNYLTHEMLDKKECVLNPGEWILENIDDVPRQENGYDCGVFALKYADYEARDAQFNSRQTDMPYFRSRMMFEILQ